MSAPAWRWAPDKAVLDETALAWLDTVLADWSDRWFARDRIRRRGLETSAAAKRREPAFGSSGRAALDVGSNQKDHLAERALDMEVAQMDVLPADRDLLDGLLETLGQDLVRAVEAAIGGDAVDPAQAIDGPSGAVRFPLADETGRVVATIVVARAAMVAARLGGLPPPSPRRAPLVGLQAAVAETPVTLHVQAGAAWLSLTEARDLAVGDVLVLDRSLEAAFDLVHAAVSDPIARAALVDAADPAVLRLAAA